MEIVSRRRLTIWKEALEKKRGELAKIEKRLLYLLSIVESIGDSVEREECCSLIMGLKYEQESWQQEIDGLERDLRRALGRNALLEAADAS